MLSLSDMYIYTKKGFLSAVLLRALMETGTDTEQQLDCMLANKPTYLMNIEGQNQSLANCCRLRRLVIHSLTKCVIQMSLSLSAFLTVCDTETRLVSRLLTILSSVFCWTWTLNTHTHTHNYVQRVNRLALQVNSNFEHSSQLNCFIHFNLVY